MSAHSRLLSRPRRWLSIAFAVLLPLVGVAPVATAEHSPWVAAWAASPVVGSVIPFSPDCPAGGGLRDQRVRNVVFVSTGGSSVRVRLSNAFGARPLWIGHATVSTQ